MSLAAKEPDMPLAVRKITLWRGKIPHRPGALAEVLEPVAARGANLEILMGYREPGSLDAVVELWPVSGRKMSETVEGAGLAPSAIPTLLVNGPNRPGLGHTIARALAENGINVAFLVAQAVGRRYSAVFGFESDVDASRAAKVVRAAAALRKGARHTSSR
jgi:hypothetical protein